MIDISAWLFVAVILLALVSLVLLLQDRFIYFPLRYSKPTYEEAQTLGVHQVTFQTSQGKQTAFFWRGEGSDLPPGGLAFVRRKWGQRLGLAGPGPRFF